MKIVDILDPAAIVGDVTATTGADVLAELCRPIARATRIDPQSLIEALLEREHLGSTAIGDGVAIPHARVRGVRKLIASFGRLRAGIPFGAPDAKPSTLFFVLLSPRTGPGLHLNALARVSRIFRSATLRADILAANDAAEIYRLIAAEDAR